MSTTFTTEHTYERSDIAKLRKRIFLTGSVAKATVETRRLVTASPGISPSLAVDVWLKDYNRHTGWTVCWIDHRSIVESAPRFEILLRLHPTLGKFICFHAWKESGKDIAGNQGSND